MTITKIHFLILVLMFPGLLCAKAPAEKKGIVTVEAENFFSQTNDEIRKWFVISKNSKSDLQQFDANISKTASAKSYIAVLPDTRVTHDDKLIAGENFSNEPGKMAVVNYKVRFKNPGNITFGCGHFPLAPKTMEFMLELTASGPKAASGCSCATERTNGRGQVNNVPKPIIAARNSLFFSKFLLQVSILFHFRYGKMVSGSINLYFRKHIKYLKNNCLIIRKTLKS
jgi:hypothetical protein